MKRFVSPGWGDDDRLKAIRAIVESYYARKGGGLEAVTIKAISYCVTEEAEKLNKRAKGELSEFIDINEN